MADGEDKKVSSWGRDGGVWDCEVLGSSDPEAAPGVASGVDLILLSDAESKLPLTRRSGAQLLRFIVLERDVKGLLVVLEVLSTLWEVRAAQGGTQGLVFRGLP